MSVFMKKWCRSHRSQVIVIFIIIICVLYYLSLNDSLNKELDLDITRRIDNNFGLQSSPAYKSVESFLDVQNRNSVIHYIENRLQESLKADKGTGCVIPHLDPYAKEVTQFEKNVPKVKCQGQDWVKCYLHECRVVKEILDTTKDVACTYRDILYESDYKYTLGPPVDVAGGAVYKLDNSDHVKVKCVGKHVTKTASKKQPKNKAKKLLPSKWVGHELGFRNTVETRLPPLGREETVDVLIFGFDSTAKNGFIRRMPLSYKFITKELGATVLNGYNIVGDGTPAALFPILTGKTELEWPDTRKSKSKQHLDDNTFIFNKLKSDGYRTAYFEDMPWIGTFQYRFNGFKRQPADHYLRSFYMEESQGGKTWWKKQSRYCVGDTPRYEIMMNITDQFFQLPGKHFAFTFIADITHDDFNMISTADEATVRFLKTFRDSGRLERTLLVIMGDHGPRFSKSRDTYQGKLEERLPLMAIHIPQSLKKSRPDIQSILEKNADALTTPHDIHATLLDAMDLQEHRNLYKIRGADLMRGLSLFEPVPRNRSCSEAGIEPHWCACLSWTNVTEDDPFYRRSAQAFVDFINSLTNIVRSKCAARTLRSVSAVSRQAANPKMLQFKGARDPDGYVGSFAAAAAAAARRHDQHYQIKVVVGPGRGVYEASATYLAKEDKFVFNIRDISRINAYNNEPHCISAIHPHLNMYCYCND